MAKRKIKEEKQEPKGMISDDELLAEMQSLFPEIEEPIFVSKERAPIYDEKVLRALIANMDKKDSTLPEVFGGESREHRVPYTLETLCTAFKVSLTKDVEDEDTGVKKQVPRTSIPLSLKTYLEDNNVFVEKARKAGKIRDSEGNEVEVQGVYWLLDLSKVEVTGEEPEVIELDTTTPAPETGDVLVEE